MPIAAGACVRNEIDVVEAFVRHTLSFADRLFLLDHGSTDATPDILRALVAEGLPLTVHSDPAPGKYQSARMTALMREAAASIGGTGWVFLLDADEFVQWSDGPAPLPAGHPADRPFAIPWRTYVPHGDDDVGELNVAARMRHCRFTPAAEEWKVVVPAGLAASGAAVIEQGNHHVFLDGRPVNATAYERPYLAHFPIRTPGQFLAKIAVGNLQYRAMADRGAGWGWHARAAFREVLRDPSAAAGAFADVARRYGLDEGAAAPPVICSPIEYRGGPLRYTVPAPDGDRAFLAVLWLASQFADHVAQRGTAPPDELGRIRTLDQRLDEEAALARRRGDDVVRLSAEVERLTRRLFELEGTFDSARAASETPISMPGS